MMLLHRLPGLLLNKNQTIKVDIESSIGLIRGDPDRLIQVFAQSPDQRNQIRSLR